MQMRYQLKESLKTPVREWFKGKIIRHDHFHDLVDIDNALNSVPEHLRIEDRRRYTESCFGHFLMMHREIHFSAGIVHRLLLRELHHDGPEDEMRFLLGKHSVRFSKVEFCLITGLKFGVIPDTARYDMVENGIHERYFQGRDIESEELRAVLRIGIFVEQYDAVKLCLLFMLNWILMGVDERDRVPVWQWRLVEDLDAFDAFPWGAHVYRRSIYCFKHALDGRRERFEQRQQERGADVHTTETYNIYGLPHALLIFAFEVIPELGNKKCGIRWAISELPPPRILKWELSQRPWGRKLDGIFTERMFARRELVPTSVEMAQPYYEGIYLGGSLYDTDVSDIPSHVPEHERRRSAGPIDMEGAYSRPSDIEGAYSGPSDREGPYSGPSDRDGAYSGANDTEGLDQEGGSRSPVRHQPVRFTLPRQPRPRGDSVLEGRDESPERHRRVRFTMPRQSRPGGDSREGVGGHPHGWDGKFAEVMDAVQSLRVDMMEAIRKSDEKRDQQHQELLDMIRALQGQGQGQGQTSQSRMDGPPFDDHHRDFSPTGRTGTHQHGIDPQITHEQTPTTEAHTADTVSDHLGHVMTERTEVPGGTEISLLEQVPPPVIPDDSAGTETGLLVRELPGGSVPHVLPHDLAHSSSSQRTPPPVDPSAVRPLKRSRRNSPTHQRDTGRESDTRRDRSSSERSPSRRDTRREISSSHHSPPHRDTRRHMSSSQRSPLHSSPQRQRSSSLHTPPVESSSGACSPPQIQRQLRVRRPGWQLMSPYTDPCRPKKPRTRPASSVHAFKPYDLLDPDHVTAYQAYKRNTTGELYSWLDIKWERMFGSGVAAPPKEWSMLKHKWHDDDLKTVRGLLPAGNQSWHAVDWVMIPCNLGCNHWVLASVDLTQGKIYLLDPFRQEVPWEYRNKQVACLRWFIPSMLHQVEFHSNRTKDDVTYSLSKKAFRMSIMDRSRGVPQQHQGGNCGAHTLRLAEYLLANKKEFDWKEEDMGTIREKMAVEVYCNSLHNTVV
ncbi:hypothetical protein LWI28_028255 [Acer negundo]|uniref:Ubiquitin-like protease family profile domain-containing protein n=1 Tax=Acer negundo TaxID=4023 RepID=A0AAD5J6P8_ACENE|nr:hypothetical protein LWI28_028255 [Acer negundo]